LARKKPPAKKHSWVFFRAKFHSNSLYGVKQVGTPTLPTVISLLNLAVQGELPWFIICFFK
jgi:hypothetical protein